MIRIIGNRMPLWSALIAASKRSVSPWIGRPTWSRLAQSHRPSCSTTTWSALIKACPVAIVLHAAPSPICLLSLPCQASSIPTGGSLSWMDCMWSAKSISTAWSALISNGTQSRPSSSAITSSCSSHGLRNEMHFATKDLQITLRCIHLLSGKVQDGDLVAHPVGSWMPKHAVCRSCMNNRSSKRCPSEQWWDTSSPLSRFSPICCTRLALRPACAPCKNARTARRLSPLPSSTMC